MSLSYVIADNISNMAVGRQNLTLEKGQRINVVAGSGQHVYVKDGVEMGVILSLTNEIREKLRLRGRITLQA